MVQGLSGLLKSLLDPRRLPMKLLGLIHNAGSVAEATDQVHKSCIIFRNHLLQPKVPQKLCIHCIRLQNRSQGKLSFPQDQMEFMGQASSELLLSHWQAQSMPRSHRDSLLLPPLFLCRLDHQGSYPLPPVNHPNSFFHPSSRSERLLVVSKWVSLSQQV